MAYAGAIGGAVAAAVGGMGTEDDPPPYSNYEAAITVKCAVPQPNSAKTTQVASVINCQVCQEPINITGKKDRVVQCGKCDEATPIKPAAAGEKYIRCPCNALLSCTLTATKAFCPRPNCKRRLLTTPLSANGGPPGRSTSDLGARVTYNCGYCKRNFTFSRDNKTIVHCVHCKKRTYTSVREFYKILLVAMGTVLLALGGGAGIVIANYEIQPDTFYYGYFIIGAGVILVGIALLFVSVFLCTVKVSYKVTKSAP